MTTFSEFNLLDFGNQITTNGMVMTNSEGDSVVVVMPKSSINITEILTPTEEEWLSLIRQLDVLEVEGNILGEKVILKKSQRQLEGVTSWTVFRRDKYKCRYCGISNVPLTVDHIITWETGGQSSPDNLLTCCKKCNKKRGNLDYGSWMQHKYYVEKSEKYLTEKQRKANEDIVRKLNSLPTLKVIRNR